MNSATKKLYSAIKKVASKITRDHINIAVLACLVILDVASLSFDNFWVTLVAVSGTLLYCISEYCERMRYYMVYYHYDNGAGAEFFSIRGELDIKEARKFLILREKKNIVIGYWKEISAKQCNDFNEYDWEALLRDVNNMTCEHDIIDKHKEGHVEVSDPSEWPDGIECVVLPYKDSQKGPAILKDGKFTQLSPEDYHDLRND